VKKEEVAMGGLESVDVDCGAKKKWMGFKYREAKAGEDEIVIVAA
jgi:hypothetical protein